MGKSFSCTCPLQRETRVQYVTMRKKLLSDHGMLLTKKNNKLIAGNINLEKYRFETTGDFKDMKVTKIKDRKIAFLFTIL
jgi:hypothetical protein